MKRGGAAALRELRRRKVEFGEGGAQRKRELLRVLERVGLRRAAQVEQLHEILCFLRAYPDDADLLAHVEAMLATFGQRSDLIRHRRALVNTGIAGTDVHFSFFAPTALWLARNWGRCLTIDWKLFEHDKRLEQIIPLLALYGESPGLDEFGFAAREWIDRMKGPDETDATFLLRRLGQLRMDALTRETILDDLEIPLRLSPGPDTPARSREKFTGAAVTYQREPLSRKRPATPAAIGRPPLSVRALSPRNGQVLIDLARSTMATRSRDLDAFAYGERRDVRLVDCGAGLQFAVIGAIPERRLLLETMYGYLVLKNGVPVGYGTHAVLFGSAETAYTVFDTFRSGEAAEMFVWALSIARHLFGVDTFMIDPYQIGQDNDDAIRSGAWWFYKKLGFEPRDSAARRVMRQELKRMKANHAHRSSIATLKKLASASVFLHLGKRRDDVLGVLPLAGVGLRVTTYLAERFGFDRERATRICARQAAGLLGVHSRRRFTPGQRLIWNRWAPLILTLPGVERWGVGDKHALVDIVLAKGGRCESEYVARFDRHQRLRRALARLAES